MRGNVEESRDGNDPSDVHCDGVYFTSKASRYSDISARITDDEVPVCVLTTVGDKFLYIIPGFDILEVELLHIKVY